MTRFYPKNMIRHPIDPTIRIDKGELLAEIGSIQFWLRVFVEDIDPIEMWFYLNRRSLLKDPKLRDWTLENGCYFQQ